MTPLEICGWLWLAWIFYWVVAANFVLKKKKNETIARLQHTVPTLFAFLAIFHQGRIPAIDWGSLYDSAVVQWAGVGLTLAGHAFSIWARLHLGKYWSGTVALKEGHKLITSGPYAFVRHPIYTGLFMGVIGSALAASGLEAFAGFAVMLGAYVIKWRREERLMLGEFGQEYRDYMARTKALVPFVL